MSIESQVPLIMPSHEPLEIGSCMKIVLTSNIVTVVTNPVPESCGNSLTQKHFQNTDDSPTAPLYLDHFIHFPQTELIAKMKQINQASREYPLCIQ